jgi:hypothetical protein
MGRIPDGCQRARDLGRTLHDLQRGLTIRGRPRPHAARELDTKPLGYFSPRHVGTQGIKRPPWAPEGGRGTTSTPAIESEKVMLIAFDDEAKRYALRGLGSLFEANRRVLRVKEEKMRRPAESVLLNMLRSMVKSGFVRHQFDAEHTVDIFLSTPLLVKLVTKLEKEGAIGAPASSRVWITEFASRRSSFFKGKRFLT